MSEIQNDDRMVQGWKIPIWLDPGLWSFRVVESVEGDAAFVLYDFDEIHMGHFVAKLALLKCKANPQWIMTGELLNGPLIEAPAAVFGQYGFVRGYLKFNERMVRPLVAIKFDPVEFAFIVADDGNLGSGAVIAGNNPHQFSWTRRVELAGRVFNGTRRINFPKQPHYFANSFPAIPIGQTHSGSTPTPQHKSKAPRAEPGRHRFRHLWLLISPPQMVFKISIN